MAAPANDNIANAIALTLDTPVAGTTVEATSEPDEIFGYTTPSVWYKITADGDGSIALTLHNTGSGNLQFIILAANDETLTTQAGLGAYETYTNAAAGATEELLFDAVDGETYHVFVVVYTGSSGTFTIGTAAGPAVPANDEFVDAQLLVDGDSVSGSLVLSTYSGLGPYSNDGDVWYYIEPALSGDVTVAVVSDEDLLEGTLFVTAYNDGADESALGGYIEFVDGDEEQPPPLVFPVDAGNRYYVHLGYEGTAGSFQLDISVPTPAGVEVQPPAAIAVDDAPAPTLPGYATLGPWVADLSQGAGFALGVRMTVSVLDPEEVP